MGRIGSVGSNAAASARAKRTFGSSSRARLCSKSSMARRVHWTLAVGSVWRESNAAVR